MQKTLTIKLIIIAGLCLIFSIGLNVFSSVIYERQSYADSVIAQIAEQHVNPQEVITPFIAIPTTVTPACTIATANKVAKCPDPYSKVATIFAAQTEARQNLTVSTDTYKRGIYHATSYNGELQFKQSYSVAASALNPSNQNASDASSIVTTTQPDSTAAQTVSHWNQAKLIIPVSDLRGVATLPTITIDNQSIKATYPQNPMIQGLTYVEVALPEKVLSQLAMQNVTNSPAQETVLNNSDINTIQNSSKPIKIVIDLPLSGISALNTVPTGQNFELAMRSN